MIRGQSNLHRHARDDRAGAAIRLTPILDPTGWKADGHDLAMYEVEVVDALGRAVRPILT
jgi:hypothetical protein